MCYILVYKSEDHIFHVYNDMVKRKMARFTHTYKCTNLHKKVLMVIYYIVSVIYYIVTVIYYIVTVIYYIVTVIYYIVTVIYYIVTVTYIQDDIEEYLNNPFWSKVYILITVEQS